MNRKNNSIVLSMIDQLSRNALAIFLIRSLRLGYPLKELYYKIYCLQNHKSKLLFMGFSAQFFANDFNELRAIETTFSDSGKSEEKILSPMMKMIQPGDVAYDIGANIGVHTVFMAKKIEKDGKIVAFEPAESAFKALQKNINLNDLSNVRLVQKGLGDKIETRMLYNQPKIGIGASSLLKYNNGNDKHLVDVIPGDTLVRRENIPLPCAVKIDVEGFEYQVIKGLEKTLSLDQCQLLCCEIHPNYLPKEITYNMVVELIKSLGFENIKIHERGSELHAICYKK